MLVCMRIVLLLGILIAVAPVHADEQTRKALDRLAEEASAFQQNAPNLVAEETLRQRAIKPVKKRFAPRLSPTAPAEGPEWQTREIVSEYSYSSLGGNTPAIREFRNPITVDGREVEAKAKALDRLASSLRSNDDASKKRLLEDFEKLGLIGTVTDFGQSILLFGRRALERYSFQVAGERRLGADRAIALSYKQNEGPEGVSVYEKKKLSRLRLSGEIWFRVPDLLPIKITMIAVRSDPPDPVREEAEIDYILGPYGCLLPVAVAHREYRGQGLTAENRFMYGNFRRFGASSSIDFPVASPGK